MTSPQHGHSDIIKAALIKNSVQVIMKRLYKNIYRDEELKKMTKIERTEQESKGTETLEDAIISKVFNQKKLMKAFAIQYTRNNVATASLQNSQLNKAEGGRKILDFIAFNDINYINELTSDEKKQIEGTDTNRPFEICYKNKGLQVKRIDINNLETYKPKKLGGYVSGRYNCAERKILGTILHQYKQSLNYEYGKLGGTLYLYTKMEPCLYCFTGLKDFINETGTKICLVYEELLYEITRDRLNLKPPNLLNLIAPTPYAILEQYDINLAKSLQNEMIKRNKPDIATRWQPFESY